MNPPVTGFIEVSTPQPHPPATRRLLQDHPEIRGLIGRNPWTAGAIGALVALQSGVAILIARRHVPVWEMLLVAYTLGAIVDHALWALIHEATHRLIFAHSSTNAAAGMMANLPLLVPGYAHFHRYHLRHHSFQGIYEHDAGLPSEREARLVGNSPVRKTLWLMLFPIAYSTRPLHLTPREFVDREVLTNTACQLAYTAAVFVVAGPVALVYLALSFWFSISLHPLGARWIQEHTTLKSEQETYSYYGPANHVSFNVGFHNEHHDFPSIPWNRLPRLHAIARAHYNAQDSYRSWTRLLVAFLTDRRYSLWGMVRRVPPVAVSRVG